MADSLRHKQTLGKGYSYKTTPINRHRDADGVGYKKIKLSKFKFNLYKQPLNSF